MALSAKCPLAFVVIGSLAFGDPRPVLAQHITIDGRFSPAQTLVGPNYTIGANLGKQVGTNLFHSFGQFSLSNTPVPESATFTSTGSTGPISNVISRVTGGSQSNINGAIVSPIPGANLYLINPSGIVFGPNATVNVSGSFHVSSADYLKMSDGAKFQATNPDASTLSAAPPAAFGFLNAQPAAITVNGSNLGPVPGTLGLVGGPVSITGGRLSAPAGTIHVTSAAGTGEVPINPRNKPALTVTSFGPVAITDGSRLNVSDPIGLGSGGSVVIRSGLLTIDASEINADNYGSGPGGRLLLRGGDQLVLSNGALVHSFAQANGSGAAVILRSTTGGTLSADNSLVAVGSNGAGNSGKLVVSGGQVSLTNGAQLTSTAQSSGNGGAILLKANNLLIDGSATNTTTSSGVFATTSGNGSAGPIAITSGNLGLTGFSEIGSTTTGPGNSANVSLNISGALLIDAGTVLSPNLASFAADPFVGVRSASKPGSAGGTGTVTVAAGRIFLNNGGAIGTGTWSASPAGDVTITAGNLSLLNNGKIFADTLGFGNGGSVFINVTGHLTIDGNGSGISSDTVAENSNAGDVTVTAGTLSIVNGGRISSSAFSTGNAGRVTVTAGNLSLLDSGEIISDTYKSGRGGSISVNVTGQLTIDGGPGGAGSMTGISSDSNPGGTGNAGDLTVIAGILSIVNGGYISSTARGVPIGLEPASTGNAGLVTVTAGNLSLLNGGTIFSDTSASGRGGSVSVSVTDQLTIDGGPKGARSITGISSDAEAGSTGNAGDVTVTAGALSIVNGGYISSSAHGSSILPDNDGILPASTGNAGRVTVTAGSLSLLNGGTILSDTSGSGKGGSVFVNVTGQLTIDAGAGSITGISSDSNPGATGNAGDVIVTAGILSVVNSGYISSTSFGASENLPASTGNAGRVTVTAGNLSLLNGGTILSDTFASGRGGSVFVNVTGQLTIDAGAGSITGISSDSNPGATGNAGDVIVTAGILSIVNGGYISSTALGADNGLPASTGNAGAVLVAAPQITVTSGAQIASTTAGTGAGGEVSVTSSGALMLDGNGNGGTGIAASATGTQSGPGGEVLVVANSLTINGGAQIASITAGPSSGGLVKVVTTGAATLSGSAKDGTPSRITAEATQGSGGQAGLVQLSTGGMLTLTGGADVSSSTAGAGNGGLVVVSSGGPLALTDPGSEIAALASSTASGNAGSVVVQAPQIMVTSGARIASTTAGTGAGGSVNVTTPGALVLDGQGNARTGIAASATGAQSGPGGNVAVSANSLTVEGGAQIASSTAGPGRGGNVDVIVAGDITLPDHGPQITAQSTGSGDAGSITLSAARVLMSNGGAISTEAATSMASGGDITLDVRDFLYLVSGQISTSVKGQTGNGGNITIDPQLAVLNHSSIIAQAIEGHGGNITITAGQFIASTDSIISASSQLGISGTVAINGPRVDVNGALVVLSSELRGRTEVLREACAARGGRPISSLVEAGRGGLPQDPEATLPALYIAGRDVNPSAPAAAGTAEPSRAVQTTAQLTMRCG